MAPTRNPIQPQPSKTPEDIQRKRGPGTLRTFASTVGPDIQVPQINRRAQSADANSAESGSVSSHEEDIPTRTIDRDGLTQDQDELYGNT